MMDYNFIAKDPIEFSIKVASTYTNMYLQRCVIED